MSSIPRPPFPPDDVIFPMTSGQILSGGFPAPTIFISGDFAPGEISFPPWQFTCLVCGKNYGHDRSRVQIYRAPDQPFSRFLGSYCCLYCTSWNGEKFETREDWIRDGLDFLPDAPCGIIADFLDEQGRHKDADWLREHGRR